MLALLAISPWLIARQDLTVGQIVGSVVYLASGLQPAFQVVVNAGGTLLVSLGVILGRLAEVCASAESPAPAARAPALCPAGHDLDVDGVTFAYSPHAEPIVAALTLHLPAGMHLAVVGPSGVGKSTLANLLARLATPQRGQLRLGGLALEQVDEGHLRRTVALIPQEAYVFAGTVRENLAYLRPNAPDGVIDDAVDLLGARALIERLGGLDAELDPHALSAGERQLLTLVRSYVSPARLVILDEATCHLDPAAEAHVERVFADRDGSLLVIAHRISSALRARRVLVLDGGQALAGDHAELLQRSALYRDLVGHWGHAPTTPAPGDRAGYAAAAAHPDR
jgi:ATP-binding cassette subfamily C protein